MKTKFNIKKSKYHLCLAGTWGVCALLLGAGYFVLHLPQKGAMAQVQRQYDESKDQLNIATLATRDDIRQKMNQRFEETEKAINGYSVPQDNITSLVFEIGKIANELHLSQFASKNQTIQGPSTLGKSPDNVAEAWLEVEFQSSFSQLVQFINRLEGQKPAVFVEEMKIRRGENGQTIHGIKMQLSFLTTKGKTESVAMTAPSKTETKIQ